MTKPNAFSRHADAAGLAEALGSDIEDALAVLALAAAKGPEALARAGFGPIALGEVAQEALEAKHHLALGDLVDALGEHGPRTALAVSQAYERCQANGSFERWEPGSSYIWDDMVQNDPKAAGVWLRSSGLKIEPEEFWAAFEEDMGSWEDPESLAALRERCAGFSYRRADLPLGLASRAAPAAVEAMAEGFADRGQWVALRELLSDLAEADAPARSEPSMRAKAMACALAAAKTALQSPNGAAMEALCDVCELDAEAGRAMLAAAGETPIDLAWFRGRLHQPADSGHQGQYVEAVRWAAPARGQSAHRPPDADLPSTTLSLAELASLWDKEPGASIAAAAGAAGTPRSAEIGRILRAMGETSERSPERAALMDALALQATPEGAPGKKIRRV